MRLHVLHTARGLFFLWLALMSVWLGLAGCAKLDLNPTFPWDKSEEVAVPDRVLSIWTDTTFHQPGKPAVRGFGGRIFFYTEESDDPVQVDGALTVYAFDAEKRDPSDPRPEKQFRFTAEQLQEYYSKCRVGHSYSVWIPWDRVGGPTRQISLITRFEGREGGIVIGEPATKLLPGVVPASSTPPDKFGEPGTQARSNAPSGIVQAASYHESAANERTDKKIKSTTIDLPPSFNRHFQKPATSQRSREHYPSRSPTEAIPRWGWPPSGEMDEPIATSDSLAARASEDSQANDPTTPPVTRSEPRKSQARSQAATQRDPDHVPKPLSRSPWPSGLIRQHELAYPDGRQVPATGD